MLNKESIIEKLISIELAANLLIGSSILLFVWKNLLPPFWICACPHQLPYTTCFITANVNAKLVTSVYLYIHFCAKLRGSFKRWSQTNNERRREKKKHARAYLAPLSRFFSLFLVRVTAKRLFITWKYKEFPFKCTRAHSVAQNCTVAHFVPLKL